MIITCPECSKQFAVPDSAIGPDGRKVKCSSCGHVWHQKPLEELADTSAIEEPPEETEDIPEGGNLPAIQKKKVSKASKILFVILFLFAGFSGLMANHASLPAVANILGMQNTDGVAFLTFEVKRLLVDNRLRFEIQATLVNESGQKRYVPNIVATVLSKGGREMGSYSFEPPQRELLPEETLELTPVIEGVSGNAETVILDLGNRWELMFR